MPHLSKFQEKWLNAEDCNKTIISNWAKRVPDDLYSCFCYICNTSFSTAKGFEKLNQHAKSIKHVGNLSKIAQGQSRLLPVTQSESSSTSNRQTISLFNPKEAVTRAELLWTIENVVSQSSVNSCSGKKELFQVMFPGNISEQFSLSPSKAHYIITEALGPHFKNLLLKEIQQNETYFTLQFDETSNVKSQKELQIRVRFWSNMEDCVVDRHLVTYFIGHATGDILFSHLVKALDENNLALQKVLTLGCDGPNVNKKVMRLFQEQLKSLNLKPLVDIGSCQLHNVHNAFLKGLECLTLDISDFIIKIYYFFHKRDARCEDFEKIQAKLNLPPHKFIKHISTRWLTIGPAAERVLEQLTALEEYFLTFIPKSEKTTATKQQYLDIRNYIRNVQLKASLQFVAYTAKIFTTEFTLIMQKNEPLIHVLYLQLQKPVLLLLNSIFKPSVLNDRVLDNIDIDVLVKDLNNFVDLKDVYCGESLTEALAALSEKDRLFFKKDAKKFYIAAAKHIINKVKSFKVLKYFQCLSPENILKPESLEFLMKLTKLMPLNNIDLDRLACEWRLLKIDQEIKFSLDGQRIDQYWSKIFLLKSAPNVRYPTIVRVVKAALSLTHGSADVERGFSTSARLLTEDRANMEERTLNAKLYISDGLKPYDRQVHKVPITSDLLKLAQNAHRSYNSFLEEKQRIAREDSKKKEQEAQRLAKEQAVLESVDKENKNIAKLESKIKTAEESYRSSAKISDTMQNEIKKVLSEAVKQKDLNKTAIVQEMHKSLETLRDKEKRDRQDLDKLRQDIHKRKSKIIDSVSKKRKL